VETTGRHLLCEYHGCDAQILGDPARLEALLQQAAAAAGATVVHSVTHRFAALGVSGVLLLEESHLSIHTWPERGYAAVDFYTCGTCQPQRAHQVMLDGLRAERAEVLVVDRGGPEGIRVRPGAQNPNPILK